MTAPTTPPGPGPQNRLPLILGVGAGLLLLIFVLTQVLDDDEDTETSIPPPVPTTATTLTPPTTTAPGEPPAETFETFNTKNPFVPLRIVGTGTGAGATGGGGTTATTTATGATPGGTTTGPAGTTAPGTAGVATGGSTAGGTGGTGRRTEPVRGARVALLDVFVDDGKTVANVRVNDTVYKVSAGQVFATNFKAVSLSQADGCGRFVFGDDAFRLCKGEETLK